ncbi:MAG: DUF2207 domain-containing protein, partial [Rhizobiaceae bacterium]
MNQSGNIFRYLSEIAFIFLLFFASSAQAAEVIRSFDSNIQVSPDGVFTVTETIKVRAEGRKIRRGIYRDFPLLFEDVDGQQKQVGFKLLSVARDGKTDGSRQEKSRDKVRIYIGDKNYFLPTGTYTYKLVYETDRQVRFFDDHEEVYWNATGNFWDFPIEEASAKIILPEGVAAEDTRVFTGRVGSTQQAARISTALDSRVIIFTSNQTLHPGDGMTVLVKLPKGSIDPPSEAQQSVWFWQDNRNIIIGILVLIVVSLFYFVTWWRIGRDPPGGAIVPRWDVPMHMSPALVNYIRRKGLAGKGFDAISAAVLNLAVNGHVTLDKSGGDLHIRGKGNLPESRLPVGEAAILKHVRRKDREEFVVSEDHSSSVKALQTGFSEAMEREHRNKFYQNNHMAVFLGVVLSVAGIAALLFFGNFSEDEYGLFFVGGMITVFVTFFTISLAKQFARSRSLLGKIWTLIVASFFTFAFLSGMFTAILSAFKFLGTYSNIFTIVIGILVLNILFFFLLGAPTPLGRKRMDEIEGLETYLTLAEKDRMNMPGVPDFSTEHYEELLPYAVALGVEKPWSRAFEAWLAAAVAAGAVAASYSPGWYRGRDFNSGSLSGTMD